MTEEQQAVVNVYSTFGWSDGSLDLPQRAEVGADAVEADCEAEAHAAYEARYSEGRAAHPHISAPPDLDEQMEPPNHATA